MRKRTLEQIRAEDVYPEFVTLMDNRMLISGDKYGPVADAYPHKVDAMTSARDRINLYLRGSEEMGIKPGNTEYLVDAANFLRIEWKFPRHPDARFEATDDDGSPGRISVVHRGRDKRHNDDLPSPPPPSGEGGK